MCRKFHVTRKSTPFVTAMAICAAFVRSLPRNRAMIDKRMRETLGIRRRIEKRDRSKRFEPDARRIWVARPSFRDDEGRRKRDRTWPGRRATTPG